MRSSYILKTLSLVVSVLILFSFNNLENEKKIVVVDIGHGGSENGAFIGEILEKDINLEIGKSLKSLNKNPNIEIILTRDDDVTLSLEDRIKNINTIQPDYLISIHSNFTKDEHINGTELFHSSLNTYAEKAGKMAKTTESVMGQKQNINKNQTANFKLLKDVDCPALMIEVGFLSNSMDFAKLTSEEGRTEIAELILESVYKF